MRVRLALADGLLLAAHLITALSRGPSVEPMVNLGGPDVEVLSDGWTAVTVDGKLSAHFEHTIAILEDGNRVLSRP